MQTPNGLTIGAETPALTICRAFECKRDHQHQNRGWHFLNFTLKTRTRAYVNGIIAMAARLALGRFLKHGI